MFGPHLTLDFYGCDKKRINDYDFVHQTLCEMPEMLGMHKFSAPQLTKIPTMPNSFDKGGLTGFVILVESHIAIHTFPNDGFVSFDIFSCKYFNPNDAAEFAKEFFGAQDYKLNYILRK